MFNFLWALLNLPRSGRGQAMTEYILIISIVAVGLIVVIVAFRSQIAAVFKYVRDRIAGEENATIEKTPEPVQNDPYSDGN